MSRIEVGNQNGSREQMVKCIPNALSVLRIPLSLVLLQLTEDFTAFLSVYLIAGFTDVLDGFLARRFGCGSKAGARLDGFADTVFMISMLAVVLVVLKLHQTVIEWVALGAVGILKLANLLLTKIKFKQWGTMHTLLNKLTALPVFVLVPVCVLQGVIPEAFLLVSLALVFCANLEETLLLLRLDSYDPDTKGWYNVVRQTGV